MTKRQSQDLESRLDRELARADKADKKAALAKSPACPACGLWQRPCACQPGGPGFGGAPARTDEEERAALAKEVFKQIDRAEKAERTLHLCLADVVALRKKNEPEGAWDAPSAYREEAFKEAEAALRARGVK